MVKLQDFASSVAIVVSSCDAFFDAWRPFYFFFRKFWPECPFRSYLIVNGLRIRCERMQAIAVGADRGWSSNMKTALREITEPRLLYLQEDYFLDAPVHHEQLATDFQQAVEQDADSLCLRARSQLEPGFRHFTERIGLVPPDSDGRTRCQLTLWKRDALLSVLHDGENAWEMEARGSERTRDMRIFSYSTRKNLPIPYLMSAIVRGLWAPEALALCDRHHVSITPRLRGIYTSNALLRRFRRARAGVAMRAALAEQPAKIIDLDAVTSI